MEFPQNKKCYFPIIELFSILDNIFYMIVDIYKMH